MAIAVGTVTADITGDPSGFNRAIDGVRASGQKFARQMGRRMQRVGSSMTRSLTLPLAAAGAAIFKLGGDFEAEMSKITGLVGVSEDQVNEWRGSIRDMAADVGRGPGELAEAMFFVTSAGFRGAEAMDVLDKSARAASAGLGETKQIADLVTSSINAYGIENLSAAEATDTLTAAVREGKLEAESLAPVLGQVLPIASNLGIEFNEVAGFMAAMSRTGLDAARGSTALRAVMNALVKPTAQAQSQLEEVGLSVAELREQAGEQGIIPVLMSLRDAFGDNQEAMANVFPNVRALTGVLNVLGQDADIVNGVMEGVADSTGSTDRAFDAMAKTGKFQLNAMLAEAQSLAGDLYDSLSIALIPVFESVTSTIQSLRNTWSTLSSEMQVATFVAGGVVAAIGPVLTVLGFMVSNISALIPIVSGLAGGIKTLTSVMIANPILAVASAVAFIGTRAVIAHKELNTLKDAIQGVIDQGNDLDAVNERIAEIGDLFSEAASVADTIPGVDADDIVDPTIRAQLEQLIELQRRLSTQQVNMGVSEGDVNDLAQFFDLINIGFEEAGQAASSTDLSIPFVEAKKPVDELLWGLDMVEQGFQEMTADEILADEGNVNIPDKMFPPGSLGAMQERLAMLRERLMMATDPAIIERLRNEMNLTQEEINQMTGNVNEGSQAMAQFGQIAGQALSQAVLHGKNLSDVLKNLAKQLASRVLIQGLTALITGGSSLAAGSIGSAIFGGLFHSGGIVGGSGERMILAKGGEGVFTPGQMRAMGSLINSRPQAGVSEGMLSSAFESAMDRKLRKLGPDEIWELGQKGRRGF